MASVNLNNSKLQEYEKTKNSLVNEAQSNYDKTSQGAEQKYNELIDSAKDYGQQQAEITQAQTNQTIAEINQQKDKTEKDYIKEQKAGYTDYAKQINAYGTNAEIQASAGLTGSGYSESSKISAYNTYQNRYATARESYNQAVLNYNNQITQAQLQNSALLAEIAYNSLQTQLQLALEGFQYQNELLNNLLSQKLNINSTYESLWQSQYNTLLNEAQFNEQMAYQRERDAIADSQWQQQFNLSRASAGSRTFTGGGSGSDSGNGGFTNENESNVDELYKEIKKTEPNVTDNEVRKHEKWVEDTILNIQSMNISPDEKEKLIKKLRIGEGNYGRGGGSAGGR